MENVQELGQPFDLSVVQDLFDSVVVGDDVELDLTKDNLSIIEEYVSELEVEKKQEKRIIKVFRELFLEANQLGVE